MSLQSLTNHLTLGLLRAKADEAFIRHLEAEELPHESGCWYFHAGSVDWCSCSRRQAVSQAHADYALIRAELAQMAPTEHAQWFWAGERVEAILGAHA
jgi:hypothetical protein